MPHSSSCFPQLSFHQQVLVLWVSEGQRYHDIDPQNWAYVPTLAINGTFVIAGILCVEPCCRAAADSHDSDATNMFWPHHAREKTKTSLSSQHRFQNWAYVPTAVLGTADFQNIMPLVCQVCIANFPGFILYSFWPSLLPVFTKLKSV